jgi:hypothetical protein
VSPWAKRALTVAGAVALHEGLARGLARAGLIERLLAPSGAWALAALVAAVALYALRLALLFVVPGLLVARLVIGAIERRRRAAHRPRPR